MFSQRRKAFTLIELLVVIGIIAVLMTLLTLGVRSINKSAKEKATRTVQENLKGFITERNNTGGMSAIYLLYGSTTAAPYGVAIPAPGDVKVDGPDRLPSFKPAQPGTPPQPLNEVARTQMVMGMLRSVPMNAKTMAQMPSDAFLRPAPVPPQVPVNAPIPVDGWGNPMIFVPGGGLANVCVTGADGNPTVRNNVVAPDGKGFWASAGADGVFTDTSSLPANQRKPYGDDNVYSFEN